VPFAVAKTKFPEDFAFSSVSALQTISGKGSVRLDWGVLGDLYVRLAASSCTAAAGASGKRDPHAGMAKKISSAAKY
jgi:hypothetical protein